MTFPREHAAAKPFWTIRAAKDKPHTGELLLYGLIGSGNGLSWMDDEITPKSFKTQLDDLGDISDLNVFINSDGGDVFAGQAIYSMLKRHPATVTVYVDGLAGSIASVVAMSGDRVVMPRNAMMMVHNPWTMGIGDAEQFRKIADSLDQIRESILVAYQDKTGKTRDDLIPMLNAETWMTAEQAVQQGFADEVESAKAVAASVVRPGVLNINGLEFDITRFKNAPAFLDLRDADQELTARSAERALRDAGFSRAKAKSILAAGWQPEEKEREAPTLEERPQDGMRLFVEYQKMKAHLEGVRP